MSEMLVSDLPLRLVILVVEELFSALHLHEDVRVVVEGVVIDHLDVEGVACCLELGLQEGTGANAEGL